MEYNTVLNKIPLIFRYEDAKELGSHIANRRSIVLIGMKRVGIGNFLSFFINRKDVIDAYIPESQHYLFIPADMNDLVELEIAPFWTLTLKRIVDAVEGSSIKEGTKKEIRNLFLESIQLQDLFFTIDSVRLSIKKIIEQGLLPTLFFIRFDRLKDSLTPEFFANLEGLRDSTHQQLSYIFTSYLPFKKTFPNILTQAALSILYKNVYLKPTTKEDRLIIFKVYKKKYEIGLTEKLEKHFLTLVDGHFQYLQLGLISLHNPFKEINTEEDLIKHLLNDERIRLQSEELWESLSPEEQKVLIKIATEGSILREEKIKVIYLWNTGFVRTEGQKPRIFSPLFSYFVKERVSEEAKDSGAEFSKKELLFFEYLKENIDNTCERERIIEEVWPEASELGISDWAIDKLAARVRAKLKFQKSKFEIQTIKTRGFKLTES
jgi:hypothetical protein